MAPPAKETDLTSAETTYLESCLVNYRNTPSGDKEDFRNNCVRYIMRQRSLDDHPFTLEHFSTKVRNWFQNHSTKSKMDSLPINVNQRVSAKRAWAIANEKLIRANVEKRKASAGGEELSYLNTWNDEVRQLWDQVPQGEKEVYERLAQKWELEGPEESVKTLIAQKRAPKWMRSVSHLFWHQCKMPIFIYGMYKDNDGNLHAAVYDTSNLWREDDKTTPLLRNVPGWDQDFRRVAWNFFSATLRPDLAAADTLQVMKAAKRLPPPPFQFEFYPDNCPILVDTENGKTIKGGRMQEIFREYLKAHYNLAAGREMRAPPWGSLITNASKFFDEGMLPVDFKFNDPSHIGGGMVGKFFTHVVGMEKEVPPRRFRFSHYETGPLENRQYHPAVYNGTVEHAAPRRARKGVTVPEFLDPPLPDTDEDSSHTDRSTASPAPSQLASVTPLHATLAAGLEAARAELQAEREMAEKRGSTAAPGPSMATRSTTSQSTAADTNLELDEGPMPWLDAEIDAASLRSDDEFTLTDDEFFFEPPTGEDSDDEVENALVAELVREAATILSARSGDNAASRPRSTAQAVAAEGSSTAAAMPNSIPSSSRPVDHIVAAPATMAESFSPPCHSGTTALTRATYLRGLTDDCEYQELLRRVQESLQVHASIKAQNPVFWGTWGHKSPHVPEAVHLSDKKVTQLIQWIKKPREAPGSPADIQRFCLVVGITLRDISILASIDGRSLWPEHVPTFMSRSSLEGVDRAEILAACEEAYLVVNGSPAAKKGKGKGKGKPAVAAARVNVATPSAPSAPTDVTNNSTAPVRRSSRAAARR